jgi:hypothetical protein
MQQQITIAGSLYLKRQKHHQQRKHRQIWVHAYSSRATFQLMFTHDCVSIERLLWPVVWAVVASYDWLHDRSLITTTCRTIINRTIDLFLSYFIVRLMNHQPYDHLQHIAGQSQYAIAIENRVDWSYFDLLSLIARYQNRAIQCDWGFISPIYLGLKYHWHYLQLHVCVVKQYFNKM